MRKVDERGRITLPPRFRERLGTDKVDMREGEGRRIEIVPLEVKEMVEKEGGGGE